MFITGEDGFLGSRLCNRFLVVGYHVIVMDNLITGNLANIEHLFKREDFEFYYHDVSEFVFVPSKPNYILHFALLIEQLGILIKILKTSSLSAHNLLSLARLKRMLECFKEHVK